VNKYEYGRVYRSIAAGPWLLRWRNYRARRRWNKEHKGWKWMPEMVTSETPAVDHSQGEVRYHPHEDEE
jgi:hypothetical protein